MRTSFVISALVATAIVAACGCTLPLQGLPADGSGGAVATTAEGVGGAGGVRATSVTTATTTGPTSTTSTGPAECTSDISCGTNGACVTYTCAMGACMKTTLNDQMKVGADTLGDCKQTLCMDGAEVTVPDLQDFSDDGNPCTVNGCDEDGPTVKPAANQSPCGQPNQHCFNTACVECEVPSQCPQGGDACSAATCFGGKCSLEQADDGAACGGGGDCTNDGTCAAGKCVNEAKSNGTSCGALGASKCTSGGCCGVAYAICDGGATCCQFGQHCAGYTANGACTYIP